MCRSRRELSNEYLLAKIGVDTAEDASLRREHRLAENMLSRFAENVPPEVFRKLVIHLAVSWVTESLSRSNARRRRKWPTRSSRSKIATRAQHSRAALVAQVYIAELG